MEIKVFLTKHRSGGRYYKSDSSLYRSHHGRLTWLRSPRWPKRTDGNYLFQYPSSLPLSLLLFFIFSLVHGFRWDYTWSGCRQKSSPGGVVQSESPGHQLRSLPTTGSTFPNDGGPEETAFRPLEVELSKSFRIPLQNPDFLFRFVLFNRGLYFTFTF